MGDRSLSFQTEAGNLVKKFKDMGDGTFAEVHYVIGELIGGEAGGAGVDLVAVKDGSDATRKLVVDANGRIGIANFPATQPVSGTVSVSNLPSTQAVSGTVAVSNHPASLVVTDGGGSLTVDGGVSVSNFPATQPVSGTVGVSNFPATQPVSGSVSVSNLPATQPVSGSVSVANFPATQPVSGTVTVANPSAAPVANLAVTATGAAAAAVTLTLPAPGAGLFHYLTSLEVMLYSTAARTGTATPVTVTTTNLPGTLALTFPSAGAIGTLDRYAAPLRTPLKAAAANTATTVVCPVVTGGLWRVTATYYAA